MPIKKDQFSKKFKKRWFFLALLVPSICFILGKSMIPRFPFGPYLPYDNLTFEQVADVISYDRLTTEENFPFFGGDKEAYNKNKRPAIQWNQLAIDKYPDVRSCLVKKTGARDTPDLRFIDWDSFESLKEVEVCFWRIFSSLGLSLIHI